MVASVSDDNASLAATHSARRRDIDADRGRVVGVECGHGIADRPQHVLIDGFIEVDAAQSFDALRFAEDLEPLVDLAEDRRVEGPAAEVVDADDRAVGDPRLGRVVDRRGLGFGERGDTVEVGHLDGLGQQVGLVRTPVGGVRHRHGDRRTAFGLGHLVDDPAQQAPHERGRGVRRAADDDGSRVAEAALELAGEALGFGGATAVGGFAGENLLVLSQQDQRRDNRGAVAQAGDLDLVFTPDRGRRVRGTEVNPEVVGHQPP